MLSNVTHLFIKYRKGVPLVPVDYLTVIKGQGIKNDMNASPISPRQILVTRKEDLDEIQIPYGGLRENVIVEGISEKDFVPGALLTIGKIKVRLTFHCEPCKRIADVVPSLKAVIHRRGILGVILTDGEIAVGDTVKCQPNIYEPVPEITYKRFLNFVALVPKGNVVTYKIVAKAIGAPDSFIRAMPKYIEKALLNNSSIPVHRIVDESGSLITKYVPDQLALLEQEGIYISSDALIDIDHYRWNAESLYLN